VSIDTATRDGVTPMDSEERCELTELIKAQCAHCRTPPRPRFVEALFDTPGNDDEDAVVAIFTARFDGRCARCDGFFYSGDWISRTAAGNYWCPECTS
jgi:hypothetical protein